MSKRLFFADLTHCGTITNADTMPFGVASIAAYAAHRFGPDVEIELFKFPDELNEALRHRPPDVLCLSNYVWSANLSHAFARHVRETRPDTTIVMGGPNISITREGREAFLRAHPEIDFYVKFEGEIAFAGLYEALARNGFDSRALRAGGEIVDNVLYLAAETYLEGIERRVSDLGQLPSPYATGLMDKFFDQGLRPLVEFTRGCPYACTFCTDSHSHRSRVYRRSLDYVQRELDYIAAHLRHPSDLIIADLNFGMYQEDVEVAKFLRRLVDRTGWPRMITASPGKSHPERVLETTRTINGPDKGIIKFAASMQSTDDSVLDAIKRKNLPLDRISSILEAGSVPGDSTEYFSELILGLPGDSKERHLRSLSDLIDKAGMNVVNVHQLTLLQGSPMALPAERDRYAMDVRHRIFVGCIGRYRVGEALQVVAEPEEVVVGNATMPFEDWLDCRVMSLLVKIYVDRDYFIEVLGLIRRLGLSTLALLDHLRRNVLPRKPALASLIKLYLEKTVEPLFADRESLMSFLSASGIVEKFESGELGGNELLVHRAMAYLNHNDDLHDALREAAIEYIGLHQPIDDALAGYIEEAARFSKLRKFNPANMGGEVTDTFGFDFIAAKERAFRVLPQEVALAPRPVRFFFGDGARAEIEYAMRTWVAREGTRRELDISFEPQGAATPEFERDALTRFNFGKLFHYSNLRVMNRTAEFVG
jgi:radical SAM superfamily enzyme YgiQ (UPF0313 family)